MKTAYLAPNRSGPDEDLKLNVLLMHEDMAAGLRGRRALEQFTGSEPEAEVRLRFWAFEPLTEPRLRRQALNDARKADIIVLAVNGKAELPPTVRTWLKQWLHTRTGGPCALVISLDEDARNEHSSHPILRYARAIAEPAGVTVFSHYGDTPPEVWDWTAQRYSVLGLHRFFTAKLPRRHRRLPPTGRAVPPAPQSPPP